MRNMTRKVLLESPGTQNGNTSGNLHYDSTNKVYYICADSSANPIVNYLPGFPANKIKAVTAYASQAEVTKVHIIGRSAETIAAGTRYSIMLGNNGEVSEGAAKGLKTYSYTAPTPLTTPASAALAQVYTALANKITADNANNYCTAKALTKIVFEGVAAVTSGIVVGAYIFQGATLGTNETWKGRVAYVDTTWAATTDQVIWVYDEVGTYTVTNSAVLKKGTGSGTAISASSGAASTRTAAQALAIIDDAGYFPANPHPRKGETSVFVTAGFTTATAEISRSAVYSRGIGSEMLKRVPIFAYGTQELVGNADGTGVGDATFQLNALPVAASTYSQIVVEVQLDPSDNVLTGYAGSDLLHYEIWSKEDSVGTPGTNTAALTAALVALIS